MFSNEQCDKAPYRPVGAAWQPHSHAYHSPDLFDDGFTVSLVQCIFIPNKTDSHRRHQRTIPGARPYVSCLGRIEGANNIWGSRWFKPKTRYGQKKHLSEQMPTRVRTHRSPLGHVLLKIVKRQKNHTCSVRENLLIWFVLEGDRNWMGSIAFQTKRIPCWATNQFCRFNQIRGSPVLICWPVACDDDLAMGFGFMSHVSKIGR